LAVFPSYSAIACGKLRQLQLHPSANAIALFIPKARYAFLGRSLLPPVEEKIKGVRAACRRHIVLVAKQAIMLRIAARTLLELIGFFQTKLVRRSSSSFRNKKGG